MSVHAPCRPSEEMGRNLAEGGLLLRSMTLAGILRCTITEFGAIAETTRATPWAKHRKAQDRGICMTCNGSNGFHVMCIQRHVAMSCVAVGTFAARGAGCVPISRMTVPGGAVEVQLSESILRTSGRNRRGDVGGRLICRQGPAATLAAKFTVDHRAESTDQIQLSAQYCLTRTES